MVWVYLAIGFLAVLNVVFILSLCRVAKQSDADMALCLERAQRDADLRAGSGAVAVRAVPEEDEGLGSAAEDFAAYAELGPGDRLPRAS